jgi:hypothetical protein
MLWLYILIGFICFSIGVISGLGMTSFQYNSGYNDGVDDTLQLHSDMLLNENKAEEPKDSEKLINGIYKVEKI